MIRIEGLSKKYGSLMVLSDVDLTVERGSVCGVIGDNGAGKTTLFRCVAGLESYSGRIAVDSSALGFLPAEPFFFPKITGREYIRLLSVARQKSPGDIDQRNIFELPLDSAASGAGQNGARVVARLPVAWQNLRSDSRFGGRKIGSNGLSGRFRAVFGRASANGERHETRSTGTPIGGATTSRGDYELTQHEGIARNAAEC